MINALYGALLTGIHVNEHTTGYRYSTAELKPKWRVSISGLMPERGIDAAVFADFIISFLSCSPHWPTFIRKYDKDNTYHIPVIPQGLNSPALPFNPMQRLLDWEASATPVIHEDFPYAQEDPALDRVCAKLFSITAHGVTNV